MAMCPQCGSAKLTEQPCPNCRLFVAVPRPAEHNRAEFYRDAEAAIRVGHPRAARAFLLRLCRQRALVELFIEFHRRLITRADVDALWPSRAGELFRSCEAMGLLITRAASVTFNAAPSFDPQSASGDAPCGHSHKTA